MKKTILGLLLVGSSLFALSGEKVYDQHCASCHKMEMSKGEMLAPPMPKVSQRLRQAIESKEKFVIFVKDYIQNPKRDKGYCGARAYQNFGTMPPIGESMTQEEIEVVSLWLFEKFEIKSTQQNKKQKCGAGKCGAAK